jgi:L-seryl-tRNA(Ser) seleniumtransferase
MGSDGSDKFTRRTILKTGAGAAIAGPLAQHHAQASSTDENPSRQSNYVALGIRPMINATGNVTVFGGSVMPAEVVAAWIDASKDFVNILDLHNKVGQRIAGLIGVEAALVTTGAAGAMLLATAAVVTLPDLSRIPRLPDTRGLRNEVILQKSHHSGYDSQLRAIGTTLIDVETVADIDRVVGPNSALMFFMNATDGTITRADWIAAARRHQIPTLLDASADIPPVERLSEYNRMGFDLVAISGGKAIRGPNDTGLLLGRKDLIETAKLNANPYAPTIGRMMKVGKEDMMALLAAIDRFVTLDHQAEWHEMERRITVIEQALQHVSTVEFERIVPVTSNHQPHVIVSWNETRIKITPQEVTAALAASDPAILLGRVAGTGSKGILIAVHCLHFGEEKIMADRLNAILEKAES